mmetsp:Transcript_12874/g.13318  ORF Transcript_12874/g.13318 Transcript_12874/m.13318 type:complete len:934 (-) Transcript_12874:30-2831(-)
MRLENTPDDINDFPLSMSQSGVYDDLDKIQVMETYKPVNSNKSYRKKHFKRITNATNEINDGKKNQVPVSSVKKKAPESLDFHDCESMMYRKHETRRFFQDRGHFWNKSRLITFFQWAYVVLVGIIVGCIGSFITTLINSLLDWKFTTAKELIAEGQWAAAFFSYQFMSIFFVLVAAALCYIQPLAIGGGIPEIKAFLNGVNLSEFVNIRLLLAKIIGICFAIGAGLPIGKKGPLIQIGSIIAAVVSQGKNSAFGLDISITKIQDFRNDQTKRDFVTYGTAAGVAAGFRSPIGGVLFALEEGASFWSSSLTFRTFVSAMVTMLTVNLVFQSHGLGVSPTSDLFVFGQFKDLIPGSTNYRTYEIFVFGLMGLTGGVLGALFNDIHLRVAKYYGTHMATPKLKVIRVVIFTIAMACVSFILPLMWQKCTKLPTEEETADWGADEIALLTRLVQFQCKPGHYNELASLYFVGSNQCIQTLYHFREYEGSKFSTFSVGPLLLFFVSYFCMTALTGGLAIPMGLFIPSLVAGAAYGRLWGHLLNVWFPGYVADAGTYALMGSAAINGGVTRLALAMTIIMLETAGNMTYLLPLMITFGAARYSGKIFNEGIYDMVLKAKNLPFLESTLHTLGLLNQNPVTEIMAKPVITLCEIESVKRVYEVLKHTNHNGFPTIDRFGRFRGLILRKTLCALMELKTFSAKISLNDMQLRRTSYSEDVGVTVEEGGQKLSSAALVFYETLEKKYPKYPSINDIQLSSEEMSMFLDLRAYMDTSAFMIHESASVARTHNEFRTMGLRHLVVIDSNHHVVGIVTRKDITDKALRAHWVAQGEHMEKYVNVEPLPPAVVYDETGNDTNGAKLSDFNEIDDDDDEEEEGEEGEGQADEFGDGDDDYEGDDLQLTTLVSKKIDNNGSSESITSSILGTVLSSTKSPFEKLEEN